jgi:hypothetical protein
MIARKFDTMTGGSGPRVDSGLIAALLGFVLLVIGVML